MDKEEYERIISEATQKANLENRLAAVEMQVKRLFYGFGAAGALVLTSIWDQLKAVLFK